MGNKIISLISKTIPSISSDNNYISYVTSGKEIEMSGLDKRGDAYENKFAHDAELQFKAEARRNKLLGMWAAEMLGKSGAEADEYAKEVVRSDFDEPGDEDVFRKIREDFNAGKVDQSDDDIRAAMTKLMNDAIEQVKNDQ